jgi:hypothetical protein
MNKDTKYDLLIDIIKLIKKYGPDTFFSLSEELSVISFNEKIADILHKTGKAAQKAGVQKPEGIYSTKTKGPYRSQLLLLKETQPKKSELLLKFYDDLVAGHLLPNFQEMKNFVFENGLEPLKAKSRKTAIIPLVKQLIAIEESELENIIRNMPMVLKADDRSLAGWTDIILKKEPRELDNQETLRKEKLNNNSH